MGVFREFRIFWDFFKALLISIFRYLLDFLANFEILYRFFGALRGSSGFFVFYSPRFVQELLELFWDSLDFFETLWSASCFIFQVPSLFFRGSSKIWDFFGTVMFNFLVSLWFSFRKFWETIRFFRIHRDSSCFVFRVCFGNFSGLLIGTFLGFSSIIIFRDFSIFFLNLGIFRAYFSVSFRFLQHFSDTWDFWQLFEVLRVLLFGIFDIFSE